MQVVLAGKAHPRDEEAKHSLQQLFGLKSVLVVGQRVVYLDDYDLATAAVLVRGCDLWLNLPRPPLEASGTSGMKSAFNGGLQLSVLDGWWAEAYDGSNGWALPGDVMDDAGAQDERDTHLFHQLMDEEIIPAFYDRDQRGVPQAWRRGSPALGEDNAYVYKGILGVSDEDFERYREERILADDYLGPDGSPL